MKSPWSVWRLMFVSLLALLLAACKPYASFEVTPDPVVAGVEASFDASGTMVAPTPRHNTVVSYTWDFGDGSTGTGKVAQHTYITAGEFTVKLTVKDKAGKVGTSTQKVVVQAGDAGPMVSMKVIVQGAGGVLLSGAQVRVGDAAPATSGADGVATVSQPSTGDAVVVKVSKAGYISQTLRVVVNDTQTEKLLFVPLQAVKQEIDIAQVETAAVHLADSLGASVSLPANALVDATTGTPATGAARLQLTPWNIRNEEFLAMPGNGRAVNAQGVEGNLISAGMMTVDFFGTNGQKLQLATGKTAIIQMDLPLTSVNNQPLNIGSTIPLWHFNEATGLWEADGEGVVVESNSSPTGLAVQARVGHFSTWNWDFYITEGGPSNTNEINIRCVEADGITGVPCTIVADVTLPDGSKYYHHGGDINTANVDASGLKIVLLPAQATIVWTGTTADGRVGTATSGPNGTVEIMLGEPKTSNFVRCSLPNGTATTCTVDLTLTQTDGSTATKTVTVPPEGALVVTGLETSGDLIWNGRTGLLRSTTGQFTRYTGTATSGASGDVNLTLGTETIVVGKTVYLQCADTAEIYASMIDSPPTTEAMGECTVNANAYAGGIFPAAVGDELPQYLSFTVTAAPGALIPVNLPPNFETGQLYAYATGTTVSGQLAYSNNGYWDIQSLNNGQIGLLTFIGGIPVEVPQVQVH